MSYTTYAQVYDSVPQPATPTSLVPGSSARFIVDTVGITVDDARGNEALYKKMAASLFGFDNEDSASDTTVNTRIETLRSCGRFEDVVMNVLPSTRGKQIHLHVRPFYHVKRLKLEGVWPLFSKDVLNSMTLRVGSPYSPGLLDAQRTYVRELYEREGIALDSISISSERDEKDGNYNVLLKVQTGRWYQIEKVIVSGSGRIRPTEWRYRLGGLRQFFPLKGQRFVRKNYENALKSIIKKYRKLRFYDIRIRDSVITDSTSHTITLQADVETGRRYTIKFEGNRHFSDRKLRKLCRFESGNRNNLGIKKCREQLSDFYHQKGFPSVKIGKTVKETTAEKTVTFRIQEGVHTRIKRIHLTGNSLVGKKEILQQILLQNGKPFSRKILEEDIKGIVLLYQQKGFIAPRVDTVIHRSVKGDEEIRITVEYRIIEGAQRIITTVDLQSDRSMPVSGLAAHLTIQSGMPFDIGRVYRNREILSALIAEKGFPYCQVSETFRFNHDSSGVAIIYTIEPGKKVYMGQVYPQGNFKTAPSVLQREMLMQNGDTFSLRKSIESQRNLQNLPIFSSTQLKPAGLVEKRDTVHFLLDIQEKEPLYLKLRTGYESDIGIFAETKTGDRNLLGLNKHGWLSGRVYHSSGRIWKFRDAGWKTEAGLLEPRLWGSRITASALLSYERIKEDGLDFHADVMTASAGLMRRLLMFISAGTVFEYELRKASGVRPDTGFTSSDFREQYAYRNNIIIRPTLRFDNRDSFMRPRKGFFAGYTMEYSKGIDNNIDDFIRNEFIIKGFFSPLPSVTFGVMGKWQAINDTTLSEDQRLFLGGTQDVRGYTENGLSSDGGNLAISGSVESRIGLARKFELVVFTDAGKVSTASNLLTSSAYSPDGFKFTGGLGIRYLTPVGPVGLLYGHKLNPFSYGAWHFSLGYTF